MTPDEFNVLVSELEDSSRSTLSSKSSRYSTEKDVLHNFRVGASLISGTEAQTCWGYLTKHLVALQDMVTRDDFSNREDFLEKCQDAINYIRFLWCIGNEMNQKRAQLPKEDKNAIRTH